jgi:sugar phosphate isomerase/epimerase
MEFGSFCEEVSSAGYDGVEMNLSMDSAEKKQQLESLKSHGLELLAQHALTHCPDFEEHLEQYVQRVAEIAEENPLLINTHTGRDWFSFEQNQEIIASAAQVSKDSGIPIIHETHRGRFNFCAATTHRFLEADPALRLCADFSHWCTVSESFLADQSHFVEAAIQRADMIHARIGFDQGPQVNDPRAPEWQDAVQIFMNWWDKIVACHVEKGSEFLPITTEFGPPPYMPVLPYTKHSMASQWNINLHMLKLLKQRYAHGC